MGSSSKGGMSFQEACQVLNLDPREASSNPNAVRSAYKKMVPNLDMMCQFECNECGHESEVEVPLTAEFFWPKSIQ